MQDRIKLAPKEPCTGCAACASICPKGCIKMVEDREGFLQPKIDTKACVRCHQCEKTCPILNPQTIPSDFETKAYAAINKDEEVRMRSSSGGMFHALAKWTIEQGGVVFGARFDEKWEVIHDYTETTEGIEPFMRSKYVQSRVGDTFKQAKQFLEQGRWVLFSGTPCQVGGLQAYLKKKYERLVLVDFICHGVPSPKVWNNYLSETFKGDRILKFNFRDKSEGWNSNQCIVSTTTATTTHCAKLLENPFFRGFRNEIYLRHCCYRCLFRNYHRGSNFTIADYWGVENTCPEMYDNKGTSIVFVHNSTSDQMLNGLENLRILTQRKNDAINGNRGMDIENPIYSPLKRFVFFSTFKLSGFISSMVITDAMTNIEKMSFKYKRKIKNKLAKLSK